MMWAGNLLSFSRWSGTSVESVNFVYNGANQIECLDGNGDGACGGAQDTAYTYDPYGNLLSDGSKVCAYDGANRLVSVSDGVSTTTYAYNGDGDRVTQTVDGVTTSTSTTYTDANTLTNYASSTGSHRPIALS